MRLTYRSTHRQNLQNCGTWRSCATFRVKTRQKAEGRIQKAESRKQKAEGRKEEREIRTEGQKLGRQEAEAVHTFTRGARCCEMCDLGYGCCGNSRASA